MVASSCDVPGNLLRVGFRVKSLCHDYPSKFASISTGVVPDPVTLVFPDRMRVGHCPELSCVLYFINSLVYVSDRTKPIRIAILHFCRCLLFMGRTVQAHSRLKVINFSVVFLLFLIVYSITCSRSYNKWKEVYKVFLTPSENEENVAAFFVIPCNMVLSVGEPATAGFYSSYISSRSRLPVEVTKSWPC